MEVYDNLDPDLLASLEDQKERTSQKAYSDRWGDFISGYTPIYDSTGKYAGLVGVDMRNEDYERQIRGMKITALSGLALPLIISLLSGMQVNPITFFP